MRRRGVRRHLRGGRLPLRLPRDADRALARDRAEPGVAGSHGLRRNIARGTKLLLLSTANYERSEARAVDGVAFYLSNPFRADTLAEKIRELLRDT